MISGLRRPGFFCEPRPVLHRRVQFLLCPYAQSRARWLVCDKPRDFFLKLPYQSAKRGQRRTADIGIVDRPFSGILVRILDFAQFAACVFEFQRVF